MASRKPAANRWVTTLLAGLIAVAATTTAAGQGLNDDSNNLIGDGVLDDGFFQALDFTDPLTLTLTVGLAALLATLFFIGGTRYVNADNILENDARRSIFEYIQTHPGSHLRATATALDLSTTNVLWHLRKLEAAKLVNSKKIEGYKVFYPVEGGIESKRRALAAAALKNDNAQAILDYLSANPSAHQREIARALNVNHGTIRWHLRKLLDADLVTQIKTDHTNEYFVSDLGQEFLYNHEAASRGPIEIPSAAAGKPPHVPPTAKSPDEY